MARNRFGFDSEHSNQLPFSSKKNPPAPVHVTPRKGQFAGPISNELHRSPVVVNVSPSGERTIYPIDTVTRTNPFASESNAHDLACKSEEETVSKFTDKKNARIIKNRRRIRTKERRMAAIITQRNNQRAEPIRKEFQDASVQTDSPVIAINRPIEDIGDTKKPVERCCQGGSLSARMAQHSLTLVDKKLERLDKMLLQFIPENIKMLTSFLIMIILIFWLTSIILDADVPSDFWRIATSYVQSFKWNYFYKQPQTNTEKYWEYLTKLFN